MALFFTLLSVVIALCGLGLHVHRGLPYIVEPMLKAELHPVPKHTLAFSWHWGTVTMLVLTFCFAAPLIGEELRPLQLLACIYSLALGGLSFYTMRKHSFRVGQMPQWIVFWAASVTGAVAMVTWQ